MHKNVTDRTSAATDVERPDPNAIEPLVLLVEDDAEMRAALSHGLSLSGFDVISVGDGADALRYLGMAAFAPRTVRAPEVIITDVRMPRRNGMELLEDIRNADWYLPVIMISAFADDEMRAEAHRLGASLLPKPFDLDALESRLRALLPA